MSGQRQSTEMPKAEQSERLFFVREQAGFLPGTFKELFDTEGVLLSEAEGGVSGHLGEIVTHQARLKLQLEMSSQEAEVRRGHGMNPESAAHAVVERYIRYYRSAQTIGRSLKMLNNGVKAIPNPKIALSEEISPHQTGVKAVLQYVELRNLVETPKFEFAISPLEIHYFGHAEDHLKYIEQLAGKTTIADVRLAVVGGIANHERRRQFWRDSLGELKDSRIVGSLVARALTTA